MGEMHAHAHSVMVEKETTDKGHTKHFDEDSGEACHLNQCYRLFCTFTHECNILLLYLPAKALPNNNSTLYPMCYT